MNEIVIVGAGGFGRELHALLWDCFSPDEYRFKGFLARDEGNLSEQGIDAPVLAAPEDYVPRPADRFLLAIGDVPARRRTVEALSSKGGRFLTLVHPSAYIAPSATLGEGCVVYPFASVSNCARVGDFVCIHFYALVGHDASVGRYCYLSPYATLNGESRIEDEVFMGTHSTVIPQRRVGKGCKISANSCVVHDVEAQRLVFGVPGRQMPLPPA